MSRERPEACCGRCRLPLIGGAVLTDDGPVCEGCAVPELDGTPPAGPSAVELAALVGVGVSA